MNTTQRLVVMVLAGMVAAASAVGAAEAPAPAVAGRGAEMQDLRGAQPPEAFSIGDVVFRDRNDKRRPGRMSTW